MIAAYLDGRVEGPERAAIEAHLASCEPCYTLFSETARFGLEEKGGAKVVRRRFGRTWIALAAAACLAAAAVPLALRLSARRNVRPDVAELVAAVGPMRPFEPRLTGGFQFGPIAPRYRSAKPLSESDSWEVLAAAAKIRKREEQKSTPETLDTLGAANLVLGKYDEAVSNLEEATLQAPKNARFLTDLSATYLVRANARDRADDYPKALDAAEKATELDPKILEAWFNRALALEGLYLKGEAVKAWKDYLDRDSDSGWAAEARKRRDALLAQPNHAQLWIREKPKLLAAAAKGDETAVESIVREFTQETRELLERELLPLWAEAGLDGNPERARIVGLESRQIARAYQLSSGDGSLQDAAFDLSQPTDLKEPAIRDVAVGVRRFRGALDLYLRDRYKEARAEFEAATALTKDRSPSLSDLYFWYSIASCYLDRNLPEAVRLAREIRPRALSRGETWIAGNSWWIEGSASLDEGNFAQAIGAYERSMEILERIGNEGDAAAVSSHAANTLLFLGDMPGAWRAARRALRLASRVADPDRRHTLYESVAVVALAQGKPRVALHLQNTSLEAERSSESPVIVSEARTFRGRIGASLGNVGEARRDFEEAERLTGWIPGENLRLRQQCQLAIMRAAAGGFSSPAAAVQGLTHGIETLKSLNDDYYLPEAYLERGLLLGRLGKAEAAVSDFREGIGEFERNRRREGAREISYFDRSRDLFHELIAIEALTLRKPWAALETAERFRSRRLLDYVEKRDGSAAEPDSIDQIQSALLPGEELIYYFSLPDQTLIWTLTPTDRFFAAVPVSKNAITVLVTQLLSACQKGRVGGFPLDPRSRLYDDLVRPIARTLVRSSTLLLVPDATTASVPFSALLESRAHHYLVQDYSIVVVPSGSILYELRRRQRPRAAESALLAIGGPSGSSDAISTEPDLPAARQEASEVAGLYREKEILTGSAATAEALERKVHSFEIVHFAGHALVNPEFPSLSFLRLAPNEATGDDGRLFGARIASMRFDRTRLVVLSACSTAAGFASEGEGTLNLARPFLAAGVPAVVASLWDVDDDDARRLMVAFHENLRAGNGVAEALRSAQLGEIAQHGGAMLAPPSWAGFEVFGAPQGRAGV